MGVQFLARGCYLGVGNGVNSPCPVPLGTALGTTAGGGGDTQKPQVTA